MKVLILSQAIGSKYLQMICDALPENSEVTVLTGSKIANLDKVTIIKSPEHKPRSFISRLNCWLQFYMFVLRWSKKNKNKQYDLLYATSNPPVNAYIGCQILKRKFEAPFIYMNWDIYPQIIEETFSSIVVKWICKIWHYTNNKIYKNIDQMITIGEIVASSINKSLKQPINISIIPIATNTEQLSPVEKWNNPFIIERGLIDKFVVLYSGKMGYGHNIPLILEAAEQLKKNKDVEFVFIGNGPGYKLVEEHIKGNKSKNIKLFPLQPADVFPYSMACGDIGIVLQENKLSHLFIPSKAYDMMACGLAIVGICSGRDDLSDLINHYDVGEYITSNDSTELAGVIQKLYANRKLLEKYKTKARIVAVEHYGIEQVTNMYKNIFGKYNQGDKAK